MRFGWIFPLLLVLPGCGADPQKLEAVRFSNDVIKAADSMIGIEQKIVEGSFDVKTGKTTSDAERLKSVEAQAAKDFDKYSANSDKIKVPEDSDAQEFWKAFLEFRTQREKLIKKDTPPVLSEFAKDEAARKKAFTAWQNIVDEGNTQKMTLFRAQNKYAASKGLKIQ